MTVPHHDAFPAGYLLVLAPGETPEASLAHYLDCACRSGKAAVWVDFDTLSATATWLLWACHQRLRRRQVPLVFCNVCAQMDGVLRRIFTRADLCIVPPLDDAAAQSESWANQYFAG